MAASATWNGQTVSFTTALLSLSGFTYHWSSSSSSCSSTITIDGVIEFKGCASGSYDLMISSSSPYLTLSLSTSFDISYNNWVVSTCHKYGVPYPCGDWGGTQHDSIGGSLDSDGTVHLHYHGETFTFKL